jgi:hypothetical protein
VHSKLGYIMHVYLMSICTCLAKFGQETLKLALNKIGETYVRYPVSARWKLLDYTVPEMSSFKVQYSNKSSVFQTEILRIVKAIPMIQYVFVHYLRIGVSSTYSSNSCF